MNRQSRARQYLAPQLALWPCLCALLTWLDFCAVLCCACSAPPATAVAADPPAAAAAAAPPPALALRISRCAQASG